MPIFSAVLATILIIGISGCDKGTAISTETIGAQKIVAVERRVFGLFNPILYIACDDFSVNSDKNVIIIENLKSLAGKGDLFSSSWFSWPISEISIRNSRLVIKMPDKNYRVYVVWDKTLSQSLAKGG